ncbi:hypothetical protein [Mucilaginibacter sp.]|uniref:hypothetical protein n=1 Tax=Mucilaginibacter sp. TaxID=1882438 RepID=UPI0025E022FA|nr:hypothetical protein [Mucilaginibacter sp.]
MFKRFLILALAGATIASCKKSGTQPAQPQTPLNAAIDAKFIHAGAVDKSLIVEYSTFNPNADCNKKVFNAAIATVSGGSGINKVTIIGENLTMDFDRDSNVMPSRVSLTSGTVLYKAANQSWPWKGYLSITKQNNLLSLDQFNKDVLIKVNAVNTGDAAQLTSQTAFGNVMTAEYALTKSNPAYSQAIALEVQASTPITIRHQFEISCDVPGFIDPQDTLIIDMTLTRGFAKPVFKDLGNSTTSYSVEVYPDWVTESLSDYIALQYFTKIVFPIIK